MKALYAILPALISICGFDTKPVKTKKKRVFEIGLPTDDEVIGQIKTVPTHFSDPLTSRVGPITAADGSITQNRSGKYGEQIVGQVRGKYFEATSRGNVYNAQTAATGVAPGTALGTTAAFCLYNPANSGKRLVVN